MKSLVLSAFLAGVTLTGASPQNYGSGWKVSQFKSFLTFGDSYTDENRLGYFGSTGGSPPPPGTYLPENLKASTGGRVWPRYVVQYTGHNSANGSFDPQLTLYNYAVSGAVCSNNLSPRNWDYIHAPFPDVDLYEVPAFLADKKSTNNVTGKPYFTPALTATNAVYAMFIGTNDIGNNAYFTDSQLGHATTLTSYIDCVYTQLERLYQSGGRYFVLMNLIPLDLVPLYANQTQGGFVQSKFWNTKPVNTTEVSWKMREYVELVNNVYKYRTPVETQLNKKFPGAKFAAFDTHSLFLNMYNNPSAYLNGTAPPNVTDVVYRCDAFNTSDCTTNSSPDSYLWYDELHPSEQADRILAQEIVKTLDGKSKYATYF